MFARGKTITSGRGRNMINPNRNIAKRIAPKFGWLAAAIAFAAPAANAQTVYGADVLVSNGKRSPAQAQLQQLLRPGDMVRDMLGWHKADPSCDLVSNPARRITIPAATMALYQNVQAAQGKNFVTLGFNNKHCGQLVNSGGKAFPDTPALRAEFAAYAAEVVRRVPALGGISLWNELNGTWSGGGLPVAQRLTQYCLLANAVIAEVRKVDKNVPIAIGATVGWNIDGWFIGMFNNYGCVGKGDPTIWLDVHPYLSGRKIVGTRKTDFQLWQASIANIRNAGITNPLAATEWGAKAAYIWQTAHPTGDYMTKFQSEVLAQDPNWAAAFWFEMLYDIKAPNAGLYDKDNQLTAFGVQYIDAFRN
ncbi:MAG TPA: hypothetical protein VN175_15990 [Rhizomicrobium sp.]|nr:hypothetical protein [Rhizomicrobium sp.]